jgi:hypothetical protein
MQALHAQVLNSKDPSEFDYILPLAPVLLGRFKTLDIIVSTEQENPVGEIVVSAISKILFSRYPLNEKMLEGAIQTLNAQQALSLGGRLTNLEPSVYPSVRIEMISLMGNLLIERYRQYNLKYELIELRRHLERLDRLALLNANSFEGIYVLKEADKEAGTLTILRNGPYEVAATLILHHDSRNFLNARYDQQTLTWEFSSEKNQPGVEDRGGKTGPRLFLKFSGDSRSLEGKLFINEVSTSLTGEMFRSAISMKREDANTDADSESPNPPVLGTFTGAFTDADHQLLPSTLILQEDSKNNLSGLLTFKRNGYPIRVAFFVSWFDAITGAMILTPKTPLYEAPITQLRLHYHKDHFSGQYFIGGQKEPYLVELQRIE